MDEICTEIVLYEWIKNENKTRNQYTCCIKELKDIRCNDEEVLKALLKCLRKVRNYVMELPSKWEKRGLSCKHLGNIYLISDWTKVLSRGFNANNVKKENTPINAADTLKILMTSSDKDKKIEELVKNCESKENIKNEIKCLINHFNDIKNIISLPIIVKKLSDDKLEIIDGNHRAIVAAVLCQKCDVKLVAYIGEQPINYVQKLGLK